MQLNTNMASVVSTTTRAQMAFLDEFKKFRKKNDTQDKMTMANFINKKDGINKFIELIKF